MFLKITTNKTEDSFNRNEKKSRYYLPVRRIEILRICDLN